ncbi:MAG: hypothetical protein ACTSWZ_05835 [Candidatus Heimdallarchaeaceae archaeon]
MKIEEFIGNDNAKKTIVDWLNRFYHSRTKDTEPYAIIEGETGNGKTSFVYALGETYNVYVQRITVDDLATQDDYNKFVKSLNVQNLYYLSTKKLILIDDLNDFPKSTIYKLYNINKISIYPTIYCIDDIQSLPQNEKTNDFIKKALVIHLVRPLTSKLYEFLEKKAKEFNLNIPEDKIRYIAQESKSVRSAINSLYTGCINDILISNKNIYEKRKHLLQKNLEGCIDLSFIKHICKYVDYSNLSGFKLLNQFGFFDAYLKSRYKNCIDSFIVNNLDLPLKDVRWIKVKKQTLKEDTKKEEVKSKPTEQKKNLTISNISDYL